MQIVFKFYSFDKGEWSRGRTGIKLFFIKIQKEMHIFTELEKFYPNYLFSSYYWSRWEFCSFHFFTALRCVYMLSIWYCITRMIKKWECIYTYWRRETRRPLSLSHLYICRNHSLSFVSARRKTISSEWKDGQVENLGGGNGRMGERKPKMEWVSECACDGKIEEEKKKITILIVT